MLCLTGDYMEFESMEELSLSSIADFLVAYLIFMRVDSIPNSFW